MDDHKGLSQAQMAVLRENIEFLKENAPKVKAAIESMHAKMHEVGIILSHPSADMKSVGDALGPTSVVKVYSDIREDLHEIHGHAVFIVRDLCAMFRTSMNGFRNLYREMLKIVMGWRKNS